MSVTHYQEWTDEDLLKATSGGDHGAFDTLYARYEKPIFHFLCMKTDNPTLAEELIVDVMVGVWKGAKTFQGNSKVSTWIFGIARNQALHGMRGQIRSESRSVNLEDSVDIPETGDDLITQVEKKSMGDFLQKAIDTLPSDQQEIIYLVFYEGMLYQEIAELLNIPLNTVKTRVFYTKKKLEEALKQLGYEEGCL